MADYISREAVLELAYWHGEKATVDNPNPDGVDVVDTSDIEAMPAADVVEVVHGRWMFEPATENTLNITKCNICGWWTLDPSVDGAYKYCPSCGAKMYGGGDDAAD